MTDLMGRGPLGLKAPKPAKPKARQPMRRRAKKRSDNITQHDDTVYLTRVRLLPCIACGAPAPNEAHHCRDWPDQDEQGLYTRLPGAAMRSGDRDAIPLCKDCHDQFHLRRSEFHALHGKDYGFIAPTRAALAPGEIDF